MTISQLKILLEDIGANPITYSIVDADTKMRGSEVTCLDCSGGNYRIYYIDERGGKTDIAEYSSEDEASIEFIRLILSRSFGHLRWIGFTPDLEKIEEIDKEFYTRGIYYSKRRVKRGGSDKIWYSFYVVGTDFQRARSIAEQCKLEYMN